MMLSSLDPKSKAHLLLQADKIVTDRASHAHQGTIPSSSMGADVARLNETAQELYDVE